MHSTLSQTVEYALRASLYLAKQSPRFVPVGEIAAEVEAPRNYLGKILSQLARAGFLDSNRGAAGGFRLAAPSDRMSLADIVALLEPPALRRCLLGLGRCGDDPSCAVHERWAPLAASTADFFANTTIHHLLHHPEGRATPPSSGAFAHDSPTLEDAP
jgi:Rrf2 family protein